MPDVALLAVQFGKPKQVGAGSQIMSRLQQRQALYA
jgi:hypothetical protein